LDAIQEQVTRVPNSFPKVMISSKRENIEDYTLDDFDLCDYMCHEAIKMKMIA
jgi:thymidylate synthase